MRMVGEENPSLNGKPISEIVQTKKKEHPPYNTHAGIPSEIIVTFGTSTKGPKMPHPGGGAIDRCRYHR